MQEQSDESKLTGERTNAPTEGASADPDGLRQVLRAELAGPVFGMPFFGSMMNGQLREHCSGIGPDVPQVLLHLADGTVLDSCHIAEFAPRWIATAVFRDDRSCEHMDLEFVPYQLIVRVTLSTRPASERPLGFDVQRSQAAWQASAPEEECHHDAES